MRLSLLLLSLILSLAAATQSLSVSNLKCESITNPLGIEQAAPLLSWQLLSPERGVMQTAYRILVATDSTLLNEHKADIWDSKKQASSLSLHVKFSGKKLLAAKRYYWKIMVWDNQQHVSDWSSIGWWQMGLMEKNDWKGAEWIAYERLPDSNKAILPVDGAKDTYNRKNILPLLRKSFRINKPVKQATAFISGLGHFEMSVNGQKAGDHFLDPGWTKYDQQALYVTFDVTGSLTQGNNSLGVMLGNGFYYIPPVPGRFRKLKVAFGYPKMICRLVITYEDGSDENIISDESWKTSDGPIRFSSIYGGEDYNANLEQEGWDQPGYSDVSWKQVLTVDGPPRLNAQQAAPLKVMESFSPKTTSVVNWRTWICDFGQNASGIPQVTVEGKKGDTVRIYPGELTGADGKVNQRPTGSPYYFEYILKGEGKETWQPRFSYYGYRYLQVHLAAANGDTSRSSLPVLRDIRSLHTRNAAPRAGNFTCSNELFNKTNALIDWAIKSNMASLFTDCPHREKLGWLEEVHLMGNSVQHNYDINALLKKNLTDMKYSQTSEGLIPEIAPEYVKFEWGDGMFRDSPEWGSNAIILPWYMYEWYGDKEVLLKSYPMMQRYAAYLGKKAKGYLLKQGLGDWYDLGPKPPGVSQLTPMGVTGTAMYYYDLNILSKTARLLGKESDAIAYEQLAAKVKQAFNDSFFVKRKMQYGTGSQAANAMAVYMNMVEPQHKAAVVENIIKDIRSRNNSLTAGDIGYRYLLRVLHEAGRSDVIFDMNSNPAVPGYGYQLAKGATALTESWQALPTVSNNHFMLGHLMEWFYRGLAGINQSEKSVGYKEIVIRPEVVGDITHASADYKSVYGTISSGWKKESNRFTLTTEIPVNTTAIIYLPATTSSQITESGKPISNRKDIQLKELKDGRAAVTVGSGVYTFVVDEKK